MAHSQTPYDDSNIFAKILRGELPCNRVYEDEHTLVFMDIMPRGDGHCLVIPKSPARNVLDIEPDALAAVSRTVQRTARACMDAFSCDGVTIQQFNEPAGGQVVFHYHVHVIPRFDGVKMRPHTGEMADSDTLARHAGQIAASMNTKN